MTIEIAIVFVVIAAALYLFASEKLPLDITAFLILITMMVIPLLGHSQWLLDRGVDLQSAFPTVSEGLSGLSSTATVTVLAMFILSAGIQRSGLIHVLGKRLFPLVGNSELRMMLIIALLVGFISGFINNTAAVAVAIPLVLSMARRLKMQASRLLIPVSFFGMLGGTLTLIGTSTNILASAILKDRPEFGREIGMFEFTHLGLIVLGVGLVYFMTVGRTLLPKKDRIRLQHEDEETFIVELGVPEGSPLIDKSLEETGFVERSQIELLKLQRDQSSHIKRAASLNIRAGDVIQVRATVRQVMDLLKSDEVDVISDMERPRQARADGQLVRVLLRNRQRFSGQLASEASFWNRYQARLIGLETEQLKTRRLGSETLHVGEIALLQISKSALTKLRRHPDLVLLDEHLDQYDRKRMWMAGGIVTAVVLGAALTPLPIVVTALIGIVAMVLSRCIEKDDLYSGVSWDVIFLLAGVIPLGIAMTKSGAAAWLGGLLGHFASDWHPIFVLMALYAVTTLLTEMVSNNASVVILVPVAIALGDVLGIDVLPMVLAVMFAASTSFLSPIGYQTNTMIYGTGLYRFTDFAKVGAPLNAILMVVTSLGLYWLWVV
ncbi:SLC13 family permease [Wenzhouxiangella marina]|uniref:Potassium transporter TrkA n=1 Tax=Wenzhouxiangella marina TaxID=1579979 RepID=A0A0K0XUL1_9GAMM|nr:SLC13 family permease [Wenzhouxiangella marina]AKS41306.1 Potassium transporter TrkA [Wenzhouxiangella marina]MBB6086944.1 di/tricarboxylate transporter [Wenzhouxiangella marina]